MEKRYDSSFTICFAKCSHADGFGVQRIVVWGMKCVSYDYDFENDLVTKWKALDRPPEGTKRRWRRRVYITDDSEDEDEVPMSKSRDHLSRKARCKKSAPQGDPASIVVSSSGGSSDEDEDLYHDADVGDLLEY